MNPTPQLKVLSISSSLMLPLSLINLKSSGILIFDRSILALIDSSRIEKLWDVWTEFAYENEDELLSTNFSQSMEETGKGLGFNERFRRGRDGKLFDYVFEEVYEYLEEEYGLGHAEREKLRRMYTVSASRRRHGKAPEV